MIVSLANTREVLYWANRPGNAASHSQSVAGIDRAIGWVSPVAGRVTVRGDTDFTPTAQLDRWNEQGTRFILGFDAHPKLVAWAEGLAAGAWQRLERLPQYKILTEPRAKGFATRNRSWWRRGLRIRRWWGRPWRRSSISRASAGIPTEW